MKGITVNLTPAEASGEAYWRKRCDVVEAGLSRLRDEMETLIWNLAGISTLACSRTSTDYNREMARPALNDVAELVKDYARLRAENVAKDAEIERLKEKLQDLKKTLLRWANTSDEMEKETGKIEYHYCASNYRIEVLAINTVLGKDGK